jgi:protein-tyrosine phosphatase
MTTNAMAMSALIPGTFNSRDLGGAAAADGVVRPGVIIRSDAPVRLDAAGQAAVRALGIRSAIDLREPVEREHDPAALDGTGVDERHCRIMGDGLQQARDMDLDEIYRHLLKSRGENLTEAVRLLAEPGALPAIVFCSAGKDRTGLVAALTLAAVGVSEDAIVADYALTEQNMQGAFRAALVRRALAAGIGEQEMAVKVGSPPALMRETLRWLNAEYGGPIEYLRGHGMSAAELDTLRNALIVPRARAARVA